MTIINYDLLKEICENLIESSPSDRFSNKKVRSCDIKNKFLKFLLVDKKCYSLFLQKLGSFDSIELSPRPTIGKRSISYCLPTVPCAQTFDEPFVDSYLTNNHSSFLEYYIQNYGDLIRELSIDSNDYTLHHFRFVFDLLTHQRNYILLKKIKGPGIKTIHIECNDLTDEILRNNYPYDKYPMPESVIADIEKNKLAQEERNSQIIRIFDENASTLKEIEEIPPFLVKLIPKNLILDYINIESLDLSLPQTEDFLSFTTDLATFYRSYNIEYFPTKYFKNLVVNELKFELNLDNLICQYNNLDQDDPSYKDIQSRTNHHIKKLSIWFCEDEFLKTDSTGWRHMISDFSRCLPNLQDLEYDHWWNFPCDHRDPDDEQDDRAYYFQAISTFLLSSKDSFVFIKESNFNILFNFRSQCKLSWVDFNGTIQQLKDLIQQIFPKTSCTQKNLTKFQTEIKFMVEIASEKKFTSTILFVQKV